jgi:predicted TPR repeat methyltransferase
MKNTLDTALKHHQQGDIEAAKEIYLQLLDPQKKQHELLHLIGMCYGQTGEFHQAKHFLEQALTLQSEDATIHNSLANILKHLKQKDLAIHHYQIALKLKPFNPTTHNNLGLLHYQNKNFLEAEGHFTQAIQQQQDFADAYTNLGLCSIAVKDWNKALKNFKTAYTIDSSLEIDDYLAHTYEQIQEWDNALHHYQKKCTYNPEHTTYHQMGTVLLQKEQPAAAAKAFEKALEINPRFADSHHNIACIALIERNLSTALKHWMKVLEIEQSADSYYNIAVIYMYQDKFQDASSFFKETLKRDPKHFAAIFNLAGLNLKQQNYEWAKTFYQQALELDPEHEECHYMLQALSASADQTPEKKYTRAPKQHVQNLFNCYSDHYDQHLTDVLTYQVPELIYQEINRIIPNPTDLCILDLGTGTGLMGQKLTAIAKSLIGIDIAEFILKKAEAKNIYDHCYHSDIEDYLIADSTPQFDIIVAADTCPYFGPLTKLHQLVHTRLNPEGIWIFTVELQDKQQEDYRLTATGRFTHNKNYIYQTLSAIFSNVEVKACILRNQFERPVEGLICIGQKKLNPS